MLEIFVWTYLALVIWMTIAWVIQVKTANAGVADVMWAMGLGLSALYFGLASQGSMMSRLLVGMLAGIWATRLAMHLLVRVLYEGEDGRYRSDLEQVLLDTANGKLIGRMMASSSNRGGGSRRGVGMINRVGPAVVREYFNADLVEFESQYLRFVNEIIAQRPTSRGPGR